MDLQEKIRRWAIKKLGESVVVRDGDTVMISGNYIRLEGLTLASLSIQGSDIQTYDCRVGGNFVVSGEYLNVNNVIAQGKVAILRAAEDDDMLAGEIKTVRDTGEVKRDDRL